MDLRNKGLLVDHFNLPATIGHTQFIYFIYFKKTV